jgi:Domain of unknown function (DUF317)
VLEALDPQRRILVSPRYLAGNYDIETALHPLAREDWPWREDAQDTAYFHSPCRRVQITVAPNDPNGTLWTISGYPSPEAITPLWTAVASEGTPEEIMEGLFSAIAADPPTADQERPSALYGDAQAKHLVYAPAAQAGWRYTLDVPRGTAHWTAPDRLAGLVHRRATPELPHNSQLPEDAWAFWGGRHGTEGRWVAVFTAQTPSHLIAGFATALTDPAPVLRTHLDLPRAHLSYLTTHPVPSEPTAPSQGQSPSQAAASRFGNSAPPTGGNLPIPHQRQSHPSPKPPTQPPPRKR